MANLFCFGLGYSASHYITEYGGRFWRIAGTVRTRDAPAPPVAIITKDIVGSLPLAAVCSKWRGC